MTDGIRNPHLPSGCCIPFRRAWPSGISWSHDRRCDLTPSKKFTPDEAAALKEHNLEHIKERHEAKQRIEPTKVHVACQLAHDGGGVPCMRCAYLLGLENEGAEYVDAHLDDGRP